MKKKVTSVDVAKHAGVSQSTVSRVFSSGNKVSKETKDLILATAKELGYQPNAIARGLITSKTKMIGIVMRNVKNPFYPEVLEKFYNRLSKEGYYLIFINSEHDLVKETEIRKLIEYNVEGVIITDALLSSSAVKVLIKNNISIVLFNRYTENSNSNAVFCENYLAAKCIADFLVGKGHKHFAFISGPIDTSTSLERKKGFEEALFEHGFSDIVIEIGEYSYESGFELTAKIIQEKKVIDSIFCANDITALGAIDAIKDSGLNVPDDISVVGFDDISMASWPLYSLTTWRQPVDEMIEKTVQILINKRGVENETTRYPIRGDLITRNSVKDRNIKAYKSQGGKGPHYSNCLD